MSTNMPTSMSMSTNMGTASIPIRTAMNMHMPISMNTSTSMSTAAVLVLPIRMINAAAQALPINMSTKVSTARMITAMPGTIKRSIRTSTELGQC